jgi:hypothetical protein
MIILIKEVPNNAVLPITAVAVPIISGKISKAFAKQLGKTNPVPNICKQVKRLTVKAEMYPKYPAKMSIILKSNMRKMPNIMSVSIAK